MLATSAPQNVVQVQAAIATNGLQGADGAGVPSGEMGQALVKDTASDNDRSGLISISFILL